MEHHIVMKTLNFLKRMHSNKNWKWIINKYFVSPTDGRHKSNWVLRDPVSDITLEIMSWFNPRRYIIIKHDYSPYDGDKKEYF